MDINKIIEDNIVSYLIEEKIDPAKFELIIKDSMYTAQGTLNKHDLKKFNKFLKNQRTIDNILTLIMKKKYGTWQNMEEQIGITSFHAKVLRWIENSDEILKHFDCKLFINNY